MGDQNNEQQQTNNAQGDNTVDILKKEIESLKSQYEETRRKLLDPDYLDYLATKHSKKSDTYKESKQPEQKSEVKVDDAILQEVEELKAVVGEINKQMAYLSAVQEYEMLRRKYDDVDEYVDEMSKLLEANPNSMTITDAYLRVKGERALKQEEESKKKSKDQQDIPRSSSTDKPSSTRPDSETVPEIKTAEDAARATLEEIRKKYKLDANDHI